MTHTRHTSILNYIKIILRTHIRLIIPVLMVKMSTRRDLTDNLTNFLIVIKVKPTNLDRIDKTLVPGVQTLLH